jgi:hypothetical protein
MPEAVPVHGWFIASRHHWPMADFLVVVGIVVFMALMLGYIWALDRV